jgi:hypothetical protein
LLDLLGEDEVFEDEDFEVEDFDEEDCPCGGGSGRPYSFLVK